WALIGVVMRRKMRKWKRLTQVLEHGGGRFLDQSQLLPNLLERVERELQVLARVRGGDDGADASLVAGDGGEAEALREDAFREKPIRQLHGDRRFADDHRRDGTLAEPRVEAEVAQSRFEKRRVVPERVDELRLVEQHIDGGDARGG